MHPWLMPLTLLFPIDGVGGAKTNAIQDLIALA